MTCPVDPNCPYLSNSCDCLMTVGGLYLPLPEHIETFCKSSSYNKCYHYIVGCEEIRNAAPKVEGGAVNRRRYRRIQERIPLILTEVVADGASTAVSDDDAYTFDISMGGFGMVTKKKILPETKVNFTIMDNADKPPIMGTGIVQWNESQSRDVDLFFSGLSFIDRKCQQAVARRMWDSELTSV